MNTKYVNLEVKDRIAYVTLDNPPVNLLSATIFEEIKQIAYHVRNKCDEVNVWIMTAAGDRCFSVGVDIKEINDAMIDEMSISGNEAFTAIDNLEIPTIVAINGAALGGGCELAMAHDLRIAIDKAVFGQPEVKLGIMPGAGGTQRMTRLIGRARASELILTGQTISAETAMAWGLVNKVVSKEKLIETAKDLAKTIMKNSPVAVHQSKKAIRMATRVMDLQAGIEYEMQCFRTCYNSDDRKEGFSAFLEKREPNYSKKSDEACE
ncbi:MAG: enoyl-CoA hydratase/isomerase family protein [Candidatus Hodarchaeales archaeon]|jgi:enoyl-CoA hydratase